VGNVMPTAEIKQENEAFSPIVEAMAAAGAQYAYSKTRRHPSASAFILGAKNRTEIINLDKTANQLAEAKAFAEKLGREGKALLLVGGKAEARGVIRTMGELHGMPWSAGRWIGGAITNFTEIKKRISRLTSLREDKEHGGLSKYTKKERLLIDREIARLETNFEGLISLNGRNPDALFVVDTKEEKNAVAEAKQARIPIISLVNSDCDLADSRYPILANDASRKSIEFFVKEIVDSYVRGRSGKAQQPEA
jgi:small subunit ribosomal protein S2